MTVEPLAQPNPRPEGLLAHARKLAKVARKATDTVNGTFLIEKTKSQYAYVIDAYESIGMTREAHEAREELERFRKQSGFILNAAPLLAEGSDFKRFFDQLAASKEVGRFYNGTDNVDDVVDIARKRMRNHDRLHAAEEAITAATCMLWRAHREEETIELYNAFTDVLVSDIKTSIVKGDLYLVEARAEIVRKRLWLTGRKDDVLDLMMTVSEAMNPRSMSSPGV